MKLRSNRYRRTGLLKFLLRCLFAGLVTISGTLYAQEQGTDEFTYEEFIGIVKKFHPLVKQADLILTESQAKLMKARGFFDPKLSADFHNKSFHDKNYYSLFNGSFKLPTWYGVELKASYDRNRGDYINPENYVPKDGLTSVGISVPVGQGLWVNKRMTAVKKARLYIQLGGYERKLAVVDAIYEASQAYMEWKQQYEKTQVYAAFYKNALERQAWIEKSVAIGELSAIDSVESGISLKTRKLELEQARLKLTKSRLELSNHVWTTDNIPLELSEKLRPEKGLKHTILNVLNLITPVQNNNLESHPKLNALETKLNMMELDRKLKANQLLPKLELNYNYISEPGYLNSYNFDDYKFGATLSFPLLMRKERAALKIAKIKIRDGQFGLALQQRELQNKLSAKYAELYSYNRQIELNSELVGGYQQMLKAEERLLEMGESSIFYINTRENKLLKAEVEQIELNNAYFLVAAQLYKIKAEP